MQETRRWPAKLRLAEIRRLDGTLEPTMKAQAVTRLVGTLIDRTWLQNGSATEPMLKFRVDGDFLYCDFLALENLDAAAPGIIWRQKFDNVGFRHNVEMAVKRCIDYFEHKRFDRGVLVTKEGMSIVEVDDLARPMPRAG